MIGCMPMGHPRGLVEQEEEDLMVLSIRTLAMTAAVSAGVVFAMPMTSQAMPQSSPVKIDTVKNSNVVDVKHKKRWKKWAKYCAYVDDWRCYRRHRHARIYRYRYYEPYYEPYYGYYRPYYGPGIGLHFNID
jgi:hypothetical protein